jgi:PAS domain S-box-containing protein
MNLAELLVDESIDRVLALDVRFHVIEWNKACETITGIKRTQILDKSIFDFFPEMKTNNTTFNALNAALKGYKSFIPHEDAADARQYAEHHIIPLKDNDDKVIGISIVTHDVAHRIKAENELRALNTSLEEHKKNIESLNNELVAKNRQLASLNSELKTFTSVAATDYSETLRQLYLHLEYIIAHEAAKLSDPGKGNIRKAQVAIQKMKLLTSDIISFTRLNQVDADIQTLNLNTVVKTVADDLKDSLDAAGATLTTDDLPEIKGYPFLVSLLFHHLLGNAVKFRKEKLRPLITVSSERSVSGSWIRHEAAQPGLNYHVITVADNGIGFDMGHAEDVFQIFFRIHPGKQKGSGIGLAVCKKAMELHGGFINTNSSEGNGASFSCFFPA